MTTTTNRKPARRLGAVDAVVDALVNLSVELGNPIPATAMRQRLNALAPSDRAISVALTEMIEKPLRAADPKAKELRELDKQIAALKAKKASLK